ncbi:hypothetical protein MAP00_001757 [Monascus purpureus]|nr:hypothetical protein MAP00_001757 [Monascus purpureus]
MFLQKQQKTKIQCNEVDVYSLAQRTVKDPEGLCNASDGDNRHSDAKESLHLHSRGLHPCDTAGSQPVLMLWEEDQDMAVYLSVHQLKDTYRLNSPPGSEVGALKRPGWMKARPVPCHGESGVWGI